MRLIDADALKQDLLARGFWPVIVKCAVKAAPAVDAVPVVRCKDCIYNDSETYIPGLVYCNLYDSTKDFDGYCDDGERRTDGT